jgi:hypothetical protein
VAGVTGVAGVARVVGVAGVAGVAVVVVVVVVRGGGAAEVTTGAEGGGAAWTAWEREAMLVMGLGEGDGADCITDDDRAKAMAEEPLGAEGWGGGREKETGAHSSL